MPAITICIDRPTYRKLSELALKEERIIDQQARFLLKRALALNVERHLSNEEASDVE